ncbi:MAG: hypothetical protein RMK00_00295 [Bacteroidota bacterium]|nr:hypothetical protein [Chlorobiota bacterium]MDW8074203.1 hypothetical protein [Bacteroidota bacterium]
MLGVAVLVGMLWGATNLAFGQEGMRRDEFYRKLESYFDRELIGDLNRAFPNERDYTFYSWDAGDFSGDGNHDLACVVRHRAEKGKRLWVYLFADVDGFLTQIAVKEYRFVELPLEVGVVIRYGICYVTEKLQQYNWRIRGYRFDGIALVEVTTYETRRIAGYTVEQMISLSALERNERWIVTLSNAVVLERKCAVVPIYPRGFLPTHGYQRMARIQSVDYVLQGAFYWNGAEDCSVAMAGAYDTNYLYMTIAVRDDEVVSPYCDTCAADRLELWFDTYTGDTSLPSIAVRREKRGIAMRQRPDAPLVGLAVQLGNFSTKLPTAKLLLSDSSMLTRLRQKAFADVALYAERTLVGYIVRIRLPWMLLSSEPIVPTSRPRTIGLVLQIIDIDNEFRPEEATVLANAKYQPGVVATEGEIVLMPSGEQYGRVEYVYDDRIIEQLRRRGF